MEQIKLVAHRGYCKKFPENTRLSLVKAAEAGAHYLELDVQLSADGVPVIVHDETLQRTGGVDINVLQETWSDLEQYCVGENERFDDLYENEPLPRLSALVEILQAYPDVHAFVELKEESLEHFGHEKMLDAVMTELRPVSARCTLISFEPQVLPLARRKYRMPVGWVMHRWDEEHRQMAYEIKPDMLICNYTKIDSDLWPGDWQWFVYEVVDPEVALQWAERGITYIESMDVVTLLEDARIKAAM